MAKETLFPARQRCKTCGKALGTRGTHVIMGLYDSYRCAKMSTPARDAADLPRECRTQRDGTWVPKRRYRSEGEIPEVIKSDPSTNWYWCSTSCGALHVGHSRLGESETFRGLKDRAALADWLVKLRGQAKHSEVAKAAQARGASKRVLAIRIKEWEDPGFDSPSTETLFAILPLYQAGLGGSMRGRAR